MALIAFTPENVKKIEDIEKSLHTLMRQIASVEREKPEAMIYVFAFVRQARLLMERYPATVQADILEAVIPFLRRDEVKGDAGKLITLH